MLDICLFLAVLIAVIVGNVGFAKIMPEILPFYLPYSLLFLLAAAFIYRPWRIFC